ncbi:MAG: hypothetical protein RBU30_00870 [Polyangia bacterium]|jgi:hypothetical protein|nr:hypothetical protein [Polyangia bacterium]
MTRPGSRFALAVLLLLVAAAVAGCPTGEGEGRVVGRFYVLGCDEEYNFGSLGTPAFFDLGVNFFVGEPVLDETEWGPRHGLDLRLQKGGNNIEDGDSLFLQIWDVAAAAERFAEGQGSPIGPGLEARAALLLYVTCPTFFGGLVAAPRPGMEACPTLDATETVERCTAMDFNAKLDPEGDFSPLAQGHSCVVFCRLGNARRGEVVPRGFSVEFGDEVQGFFQVNLLDLRLYTEGVEVCSDGIDNDQDGVVDESDCSLSRGQGMLRGTFNFEVRRGQVAQEFP